MTPNPHFAVHDWKTHAKVTRYDIAAGWLVASTVMVGFTTAMLFLIWLTAVWSYRPITPDIRSFAISLPGAAAALGDTRAIEEPSAAELAEVIEPNPADSLGTMTSVVAAVTGDINAIDAADNVFEGCIGVGDHRKTGAGEPAFWERWDIRYSVDSIDEYAAQLDHFDIELGVLGGGKPGIEYVKNMAAPSPQTRSIENASAEQRFYFNFVQPDMQRLDAELLRRADIATANRFPVQFYPDDVVKQLLTLEHQALNGRDIKEVRQTIFGVRGDAGDYEYYVIEQSYSNSFSE